MKTCNVEGCERTAYAHGLCKMDYARQRRAVSRDAENAAARRRYHADKEKAREKARKWYYANQEKCQARARLTMRRARAAELGLTLEEYDTILTRGCAICGAHPGGRYIHVDHDHTNGKVRDALCHGCNTALGSMQDTPARLRAAADYIERHR